MRAIKLLLVLAIGLMSVSRAQAQTTGRITGTVFNEQGQPIASANVVVQGTGLGVLSAVDGKYTILRVPPGTYTVAASLIGFGGATQRVTVTADQTTVANFHLTVQAVQLQGVVAVGYGTQERRTVTGAVASVKAQQLQEVPTSNAIKALQGRVAGVDIVNAGNKPGDPMRIYIRGVRSISANINPLFVVDGVPLAGDIADLNPEAIVSMEILKDAAATAVYGSRGSNGVVLITTKGAASGGVATQFNMNVNYAGQRVGGLPTMMNNEQYLAMLVAAAQYAGANTDPHALLGDPKFAEYQAGQHTDWQQLIKRTGIQRNVQVGMNGNSATTRFNLSGNYFDQSGTAVGFKFNRFTGQASVSHEQGRLRMGATSNFTHSLQSTALGDGLWGAARQQTGFGLPHDSLGGLITNPDGEALAYNPLKAVAGVVNDTRHDHLFGTVYAQLHLLPGLEFRANFGPDYSHQSAGQFIGSDVCFGCSGRTAFYNQTSVFQFTEDNTLTLNRDFFGIHHVDGTLLYGIQKFRQVIANESAQHIPYDEALYYALNQGDTYQTTTGLTETALESYMGRVVYTLLKRYTVSGSVRRDGASQLAPGNKWTTFPTVGVAWQLGDEPFMDRFDWVSSLKLRGSWGKTGNSAIGAYQTQGALQNGKINFGSTGVNAYFPNPGNPANPFLTWEKTTKKDVGLEFGVINNRITGQADWYKEDTNDLLLTRSLPGTAGYNSALQNIGSTLNKGLELQLSTINLQSWHGIRWQTDVNWAHNHNEITALAQYSNSGCPPVAPQCDLNNGWFVGFPINTGGRTDPLDSNGSFTANGSDANRRQWYDYKFMGIWQTSEAAEAAKYGSKPGQIKVLDANGDGKIDVTDKVLQGSTYPKWTASIYNRWTYKGFDLSALANIRWGYTIWNTFLPSLFGRYGQIVTDYWTPTTPSNVNPAPNLNGQALTNGNSRGYIDGSHWRIRNVQLGYTLPNDLAKRVGAASARIYGTATEPYVHYKYNYFDPEAGWAGTSPVYRTLQIGADVTF